MTCSDYDVASWCQIEEIVVAKYPFLRRRAFDGSIDTESECPMMSLEIPYGWYPLFYQMCNDIKAALEKECVKALEDFYFFQVKEKYNQLRCYHTGSSEIEDIVSKYSYISRYVCTQCGKPAAFETSDYLASFCDDCWKDLARHEAGEWLKFSDTFTVSGYRKGKHYKNEISVKNEWRRYTKNWEAAN
jgi:hypothetical protein